MQLLFMLDTAIALKAIERRVSGIPDKFALRAFPGGVFRVNVQTSYIRNGLVVLALDVLRDGQWVAFAKGYPASFVRQIQSVEQEFVVTCEYCERKGCTCSRECEYCEQVVCVCGDPELI